ncbi:MAG: tyrosine-type recombinase/integrase [Pseudomonadota bacterium]
MATFRKRATGWVAEVRRRGVYRARTFDTKAQAMEWATDLERAVRSGDINNPQRRPLHEALQRYHDEVSPTKRGARHEQLRLRAIMRDPLAEVCCGDVSASDLASYRDRRLESVGPASVNRELNVLSAFFNRAVREWGWCTSNPIKEITRPRNPPPRDRRISPDEIERVQVALGFDGETVEGKQHEVALIFLLALETAMRLGELCSLTHDQVNLHGRYVTLATTKNGDRREVPLSVRACELFELVADRKPYLFKVGADEASTLFRKATRRAEIQGLRFHDSRHEALTRLARKLDVLDLARMVGHRDPRSLMIYYNATATEIAQRLG